MHASEDYMLTTAADADDVGDGHSLPVQGVFH